MANNIYNIDFTDSTVSKKDSIAVHMNSVYPDDYNKTFPIKVYGYGYPKYGEGIQENIIRLMENFCHHTNPPSNPTEGMLWYKESDKQLYLYTTRNKLPLDWYVVNVGAPITRELVNPTLTYIKNMADELKSLADVMQPIGTIMVTDTKIRDPYDWDNYWLLIKDTDDYTYKKIKKYLSN